MVSLNSALLTVPGVRLHEYGVASRVLCKFDYTLSISRVHVCFETMASGVVIGTVPLVSGGHMVIESMSGRSEFDRCGSATADEKSGG